LWPLPVKKRMLLAEVAPTSSTHKPSCEFSTRAISPTPLDRRLNFCGVEGAAVGFEELRKNFIKLSETVGIDHCRWSRDRSVSSYEEAVPFPDSF